MQTGLSPLRSLLLTLSLAILPVAGCHAQTPPPDAAKEAGAPLSPELARRVEVMIRAHSQIPAQYVMQISPRHKSDVPGYDEVTVTFSTEGHTSRPSTFLLSADGKTLARWDKFDISGDPKLKVSAAGRPGRGGPENAPVLIVNFDDLECPFCARMNAAIPGLLERYGNQVRVVYRDFPLTIHPWAMRAAVDANCLAEENAGAYWSYVDFVHAHAGEIGGKSPNLVQAQTELDKIATEQGTRAKVDSARLAACLKKQDDAVVQASLKEGESLSIEGTPALFINGEKIEGIQQPEDLYRIVDQALVAAGKTPPPPYKPPVAPPASGASAPAPSATKPGN